MFFSTHIHICRFIHNDLLLILFSHIDEMDIFTTHMDIISKYFPDLDSDKNEKFSRLADLYSVWNTKINVISRKDIDHLYERHVLHSLAIARYLDFDIGTSIMDAGTGGGFPGIPLAIMFPYAKFTLVDSIGKKVKVVEEVSAALELDNVKVINERVEKVNQSFDFIVSRAVTDLPKFYNWVRNKIRRKGFNEKSNGVIYLKGGNIETEIKNIPLKRTIVNLSDYFDEDFFETKKLVHLYY